MTLEGIKPLIKDYVERNSSVLNLEWDSNLTVKLLFDPFAETCDDKRKVAHYFLLVASITETELIGRAENSRALMVYLHSVLEDNLFIETDTRTFQNIINNLFIYKQLGLSKERIPETLCSVNIYVNEVAEGDLLQYADTFSRPEDLVEDIAEHIDRMDGRFIEKSWMYLGWMIRPYPDLDVFENFSPSNLSIPMTSYIQDVGCCLKLCPKHDDEWWDNYEKRTESRNKLTEFALELFTEDPVKVGYPFYLLGRWVRGKQLSQQLLEEYLRFFDDLYEKTGTVPVTYDLVSRTVSDFEENVSKELEKTKILFYYESHKFNLPGGITYLPDFVLPRCKIKGRTVILEPHGIWEYPKTRRIRIGRKTVTVQAYGPKKDPKEVRFIKKMKSFRETFGKDFYVILLVPTRVKPRIEDWYPSSYDEIYEGKDIPELLNKLKN